MSCCRKDASATNDTTEISSPEETLDFNESNLTSWQSLFAPCFRFVTVRMPAAGAVLVFFSNQPIEYLAMFEMITPAITGGIADLSFLLSSNRHPLDAIKDYGNGSWKKALIKSSISKIIETGANAAAGFGAGIFIMTQAPIMQASKIPFDRFIYQLLSNPFSRATSLMLISGIPTVIIYALFEKCIPTKNKATDRKVNTLLVQKVWKMGIARMATVGFNMYLARLIIHAISNNNQIYKNPHLSLMVLGLDQSIQAIDYLLNTPQPFQQLVPKEKWIKQDQENQIEIAPTQEIAKSTGWYIGRGSVYIAAGIILIEFINSCSNFELAEQDLILSWYLAMSFAIVAEQLMENFTVVKNNVSHAATNIWRKCGKRKEYEDLEDVPKNAPK